MSTAGILHSRSEVEYITIITRTHLVHRMWPFLSGAIALGGAHFGTGAGSFHLDNVSCSGSESNITDCSVSFTVTCTNGHLQDAGVRCQG